MTYKEACIAKGTASKTDRWISIILSQSLFVWRHHGIAQGNQLLWHGSFIINSMVDGHHVGQSTSRMSQVFNAVHPSPSRHSLPSSASSVPTVCGWSVCLQHRLTQAYTEAYRATDAKTNGCAAVATSSSLR